MTSVRWAVAAGAESELLSFLLTLAVLIAAAKLLGGLSARIGQPAILGELIAGLILGPTFLNALSLPLFGGTGLEELIHLLGQVGVILLMFAAGLEVELEDLRASGRPAVLAGTLGVALPLLLGFGAGALFAFPIEEAIFIGITLSATSVSISAQTLLELGRLRTREGVALLGAAVIDDLLVIVGLSLFVALLAGGGTVGGLLLQLGRMVGTTVVVAGLALLLLPRFADWAIRIPGSESLLALVLSVVLSLAWMTEYVGGVAAITGAFLAGLGLGRSHLREELEHGLHRLAFAFFVPLFLVDIGLQADLRVLQVSALMFAGVIIVVAVLSKLLGSGVGALLGGFERGPAFRMGLGMVSRGEVGLIVAGVGLAEGVLEPQLFSIVVLMVLVTTLVTPLLLRWAYERKEPSDASVDQPGRA